MPGSIPVSVEIRFLEPKGKKSLSLRLYIALVPPPLRSLVKRISMRGVVISLSFMLPR